MYQTRFYEGSLKSHTFLITGGAGFIGSNLVEYLLNHEAKKVIVLDNLSTGYRENLQNFEDRDNFYFIEGDIRDLDICQKACKEADIILHQAALGSVPRSIKDPITTNSVNIDGFLNVLTAARDQKVQRIVYASSSSCYGDSVKLPKKEDEIGKPLSPYAVSKYVNELYADVFAKTYNMELIGLRYFNVFGPRQNAKGAYAAVIPLFMNALLNNEAPTIFGDGEQTRDFTFVTNAIQANIKAALTTNPDAVNQIYNVAVGQRISLNFLFEVLKQKTNSLLEPMYAGSRPGDIRDSLADISKAQNLLGYQPSVTVQEGLGTTLEWYKSTYTLSI